MINIGTILSHMVVCRQVYIMHCIPMLTILWSACCRSPTGFVSFETTIFHALFALTCVYWKFSLSLPNRWPLRKGWSCHLPCHHSPGYPFRYYNALYRANLPIQIRKNENIQPNCNRQLFENADNNNFSRMIYDYRHYPSDSVLLAGCKKWLFLKKNGMILSF